ncbi:MAG: selenocysteine-specific translation elongation factor [Acidimicrobiales bacterium]
MTNHVVSTAGHVDHGKSTLVKALTGTDPDRLAEEKERGLTIDLGFAAVQLPSGAGVSFVDVPGHERFIRNMLAGVGAVDACVFVVAATEGWKPQSEEHLRILEMLGVDKGLVALTKVSLVDDDLRELAELDVEDHVAGTFLEGAPVVGVDALDGTGVDELLAALDELMAQTPTAADHARPRLWIDRVFAAKGSGTVITGTLTGGRLRLEQDLTVLPAGHHARVRAMQSHHQQVDEAVPGSRLAVNLGGVDHDELTRGDVLVLEGQWHQTTQVDAEVSILEQLDHEVSRRGAHLMYLGSGEHPVRMRILGPAALNPGETGQVRLHLTKPLPLVVGDRFVLRESGRGETIGGGRILDVDPVLRASKASPDGSVERFISERGWVEADHLERTTGIRVEPTLGKWVVDEEVLGSQLEELAQAVEDAGPLGLELASLNEQQRSLLDRVDGVEIEGAHARLGQTDDGLADHPFLTELEAAPFQPPPPDNVDRGELRELVRRGLVVEEGGLFFAASAIDQAALVVARMLDDKPDGVTVAEIREAWGTTRKFALPLLARLDGTGVTRRRDDVRIAGRRLPEV